MMEDSEIVTEFSKRRQKVAEKMPIGSIAILPGAKEQFRNKDTAYPFRQESNFYYLSGFSEANALIVLIKKSQQAIDFILFSEPRIPEEEVWVGKRAGQEGAIKQFGATNAYSIKEIDDLMPTLLKNNQKIFYTFGYQQEWDERVKSWYEKSISTSNAIHSEVWVDLLGIIHELRLIKSPNEIALLRAATATSTAAHIALMEACQPKQMEYELEALFIYECYRKGCRAMAYPPIIAGGENACTLHYIKNDKRLKAGELLLIDAGAEYAGYAADITRTFPVNGKFSPDQKALYNWVLQAQLAAIEQIKPGIHWDEIQKTIVNIIVKGLIALGILKGEPQALIAQQAYRKFYMHSSGHWLGLDVHDVGEYKKDDKYRCLEPGMVLTVEPGVYIAPGQAAVDKRWWGMGIRIEDDVLVTATGYEVLTAGVPKTVAAIEQLMASKN